MSHRESVDVSYWQGTINWDTLRSKVSKAFIRVGSINSVSGALYDDYNWNINMYEAKRRDFDELGGYWFFRPNFNALTQAEFFVNAVEEHVSDPSTFSYTIDVEVAGGMTPTGIADQVEQFVNRVHTLTGEWCAVYTRASFWNPHVARRPLFGTLKLWVARYIDTLDHPWVDDPSRFRPSDWNDWWMWQYSADGNFLGEYYGVSSYHIDVNYVHEEMNTPVPTPVDTMEFEVISPLNVRQGPGVNYRTTGTVLQPGTRIKAKNIGGTDSWVEHDYGWSAYQYGSKKYLKKI